MLNGLLVIVDDDPVVDLANLSYVSVKAQLHWRYLRNTLVWPSYGIIYQFRTLKVV